MDWKKIDMEKVVDWMKSIIVGPDTRGSHEENGGVVSTLPICPVDKEPCAHYDGPMCNNFNCSMLEGYVHVE